MKATIPLAEPRPFNPEDILTPEQLCHRLKVSRGWVIETSLEHTDPLVAVRIPEDRALAADGAISLGGAAKARRHQSHRPAVHAGTPFTPQYDRTV
jgi:hypothetical protein